MDGEGGGWGGGEGPVGWVLDDVALGAHLPARDTDLTDRGPGIELGGRVAWQGEARIAGIEAGVEGGAGGEGPIPRQVAGVERQVRAAAPPDTHGMQVAGVYRGSPRGSQHGHL